MHQRLPHRLPVATRLRAGLRASMLALLAMFWLLVPQWHGGTAAAAAAIQAASTQPSGEEIPAHESVEQEAPAKLRHAAPLQASRAAALPPVRIAGTTTLTRSTLPAIPPACPAAAPLRWRLQRGQAPPLA